MNGNNLRRASLLRGESAAPTLRLPAVNSACEGFTREIPTPPLSPVHLLPCSKPEGMLEPAPRTSVGTGESGEGDASASDRWEGYWCVADERYYTCRRTEAGAEQWYRFADERALTPRRGTPVLPLRPRRGTNARRLLDQDARRMVVFGSRTRHRTVLVGTSPRRTPPICGPEARR